MSKEKSTIEGFEGWDDADAVDLFSTVPAKEDDENVIASLQNDDIDVGDPPAEEEEEDDDKGGKKPKEDDLFGKIEGEEEEDEDEEDEEEDEEDKKPKSIKGAALLNSLKEKGLVDFELEEGEELTDELADEILEDSLDQRFETMLEERMKDLDPSLVQMVKYNLKGGNVQELISKMVPKTGISVTEDLDLDEEKNQIALITRDRLEKGESQEDIDTYVEFLKDSGKMKSVSEKLKDKFVKEDKDIAKREADQRAKMLRERKESERAYKTELGTFIEKEKDFDGVKLSRKEIREFPSYIAESTVELEGGRKISPLQRDIYKALQDKKKTVLLAKLLRDDFKLEDLAKSEKTKKVREIKDNLQGKNGSRTSKKVERKSLADYFD